MITEKCIGEYTLTDAEVDALRHVIEELRRDDLSPVEPDFYHKHADCPDRLPGGLRRFLSDFRDDESISACMVHNFTVERAIAGPTPVHWERPEGYGSTVESDIYMAMCGLALGNPFSWETLQFGRLIQDVFPIRGDEHAESGHGSEGFLNFHTDDAFRPDSADYLLLFGIRNDDLIPTFVSPVRDLEISDAHRELLREERFHILPDGEHIRQLELRAPGDPALARAIEMRDNPQPVPVLFGSPSNPRIRLDVPYMRCIGDDPIAGEALAELLAELERIRQPLRIYSGTLLILDNRSVVHARDSFRPRYDGADRWLRKIIVSESMGIHCPPGTRRL
jgi:Fe(II)/alpha-ketoglutarate-dependent arginine beta-hydroxylase